MFKKYVFVLYAITCVYQNFQEVHGAPTQNEDNSAIIIVPLTQSSGKQISKIDSFKIDGETAVKQLSSRMSAQKILRTLSNVPEFSILAEGLDAITLGDVYKAAFPNGILYSISEQYLRSPTLFEDNNLIIIKPDNLENEKKANPIVKDEDLKNTIEHDIGTDNGSQNDIEYDAVNEDDDEASIEDLKEEPITDDYVYDQPIEDRLEGNREYVTNENEESKVEDSRGSKTIKHSLTTSVFDEEKRNKELSKYGSRFREWITQFLTG